MHSLQHAHHKETPKTRQKFEAAFDSLRDRVGQAASVYAIMEDIGFVSLTESDDNPNHQLV